MEIVATLESTCPSLTLNVKLSGPLYLRLADKQLPAECRSKCRAMAK